MPKVRIEFDDNLEPSHTLDPEGDFEISEETVKRWDNARKLWAEAVEEMRDLVGERDEAEHQAHVTELKARQEAQGAEAQKIMNEVFGPT